MARKRAYKPKAETFRGATATFPSLHEDVENALRYSFITPEWWFNHAGNDNDATEDYSTNVMGRFECRNANCPQPGWGSKKIAIQIRRYEGNGYDAVVFMQRCRSCEKIGALKLEENSYVDRVVYRLKKWAGVETETPEYSGGLGPPHEEDLCEGCKRGHCQRR
ncbi:hypothetical protein N658DRAFT_480107 [Parathielavia hyrcaniae]|uniref:3CxxC-type domain-containing protein n=1 Tax=Parathielavia hyrcaniae TaxID=113614 RepID=A0AAN6SXL8_9PEZI|nr:hypothetical protein N658DRAFT_480107 [Parathielavia hyrcaniae]